MAIELTTASDSVIDSIRASLSAIGSDTIQEIIDISRANYNILTPNANKLYVVNEGAGVNRSFYIGSSRVDFSGSIVGNLSASGSVYGNTIYAAGGGNSNNWTNSANILAINSTTWNNNSTAVTANSANWILDGGNTKGADLLIGTVDNFDVFLKSNNVTRLTVKDSGNIGINRLNPTAKLEISDNTAASGTGDGSGIYLAQTWNTTGSPVALKVNVTNTSSGPASKLFDLRVSDSSKFNVNALGNVGIGTSTPISKLDIYDITTALNLSGAALNIYHEWNAPNIDVTAFKLNVFSSNSGINSKFLDIQLNGTSYFNVNKFGNASVIGTLSAARIVSRDLSVGTSTIDWSTSNSFYKTIGSDTTFTFTNTLPGQTITVVINSTGNYSVTWPVSIAWESGFYPTQSKSTETDIYTFRNVNGIIRGSIVKNPIERRVGTFAELSAAVLLGGTINITEMITINSTINLTVSGTKLIGANNGGLIFPYSGTDRTIIDVRVSDCKIQGLKLTTNQPLTSNSSLGDVAIRLSYDTSPIDNITIEDNNIYNVGTCIFGAFTNLVNRPYHSNIRIQYNNIHAWAYAGIFLSGNIDNLLINKNIIASRDAGQTHNCGYNNITATGNCNYAHITNNEVSGVGAIGIEYSNSEASSTSLTLTTIRHAVSGARSNTVAFNNVYSPTAVSSKTGIRTKGTGALHVVNNSVIGPFFAGIEIVNGPINRASTIVQGNHIEGMSGQFSQFIALNNSRSCNVLGNTLTTNLCASNPSQSSWGINIFNGGEDITIKDNHLINVGTAGVYISSPIYFILNAYNSDPTFIETTSAFGAEIYNGKAVFISGLSGLNTPVGTQWAPVSGYHTLTLANSAGGTYTTGPKRYFTIPIDSNGFNSGAAIPSYSTDPDVNKITLKYNKIAICNNKFVNTYKQNSQQNGGFDYGILFSGAQNGVIKHNEFWVASNLTLYRAISFLQSGTFNLGSTNSNIFTVNASAKSGLFDVVSGENVRINYLEGVSDIPFVA